jgi:hypothetical protein
MSQLNNKRILVSHITKENMFQGCRKNLEQDAKSLLSMFKNQEDNSPSLTNEMDEEQEVLHSHLLRLDSKINFHTDKYLDQDWRSS